MMTEDKPIFTASEEMWIEMAEAGIRANRLFAEWVAELDRRIREGEALVADHLNDMMAEAERRAAER